MSDNLTEVNRKDSEKAFNLKTLTGNIFGSSAVQLDGH